MFTKIKNKLCNIVVKSVILSLLPSAYTTLVSIAVANDGDVRKYCIIAAVICFVFHIIALVIYGRLENNSRIELDELKRYNNSAPKEIKALENLLNSYEKSIYDNAIKMYKTIQSSHGHSEIKEWAWIEKIGDDICSTIFHFLEKISNPGCRLAVSIILKKKNGGVSGYTMPSRCASENGYTPAFYRDFVSEQLAEKKFYHEIIKESPGKPTILHNKKEVKEHFLDRADEYLQYIAIPIECSGRKTIGILQIAVYSGAPISDDSKELDRLVNNYLDLGGKIMLLTDKTENIHQIL